MTRDPASRPTALSICPPIPKPTVVATTPLAQSKLTILSEQWISVEQSYFTPPAMKIVYQTFFGPMRGQPTDEALLKVIPRSDRQQMAHRCKKPLRRFYF